MTDVTGERKAGLKDKIEARSIDWIPDSERHGRVWTQGPFWFLGNFQPFTVGIGLVGPAFLGLNLVQTSVASILGVLFGTIFMAFHASQGPTFGLPQMVQSRAQFGVRGVSLALVATTFTYIGFNVVDTVILKLGLNGIFGWSTTLVAAAITVVAVILAIFGHDWLHLVFRTLFWMSLPLWVILTVGILTGNAGGKAPAATTFTWAGFIAMFTIAASYNITYSPYVSDYTRYLPRTTKTRAIVASVFFGASASPMWLMPLGAWLGTALGASDPLKGIYDAGNNVFSGLGSLLVVVGVLALVATMGMNAYGGMLTIVTAIDCVHPVAPTRRIRVITILALMVIWFALGDVLENATTALNNSLLIMLVLLAPWTAINLVDFFLVRRGHYAITDLFNPKGIYGAWARRGVIAYIVGVIVEIPFLVLGGEGAYVGWVAENLLSFVDISWLVGMIVAGSMYFVSSRSLDLAAEAVAIQASEAVLSETGSVR